MVDFTGAPAGVPGALDITFGPLTPLSLGAGCTSYLNFRAIVVDGAMPFGVAVSNALLLQL